MPSRPVRSGCANRRCSCWNSFPFETEGAPVSTLICYPEIVSDPIPTTIEPFTEDDAHDLMNMHVAAFPTSAPVVKRGADLEYLAVATKHRCTLVSCDTGLLNYGTTGVLGYPSPLCRVIEPSKWLGPRQYRP